MKNWNIFTIYFPINSPLLKFLSFALFIFSYFLTSVFICKKICFLNPNITAQIHGILDFLVNTTAKVHSVYTFDLISHITVKAYGICFSNSAAISRVQPQLLF